MAARALARPGHRDAAATEDGVLSMMREHGIRVTTPRRLLVRSLIDAGDHRTADELAAKIQAQAPDVHISTIYRNLEELEKLGVVEHAHLGHGATTYHLSNVAHGHLTCESCGETTEVPQEFFQSLVRRINTEYGFAIDPHHFAMVGKCANCRAAQSAAEAPL